MVQLMSLENRRERAHQRELAVLKSSIELRDKSAEVREMEMNRVETKLAAELERAGEREAALAAKVLKVAQLRMRVKKLQADLVSSEEEVGRQKAELDISARNLEECQDKLRGMGAICRRRMKNALKGQLVTFKKSCQEQSQNAVRVVQGYMEARRKWSVADKLLSQATGTLEMLDGLRKDGVAIPDSAFARIKDEEARYTKERSALAVEGLTSEDFEFRLPSNLGILNVDQMDFSEGVLLGNEEEVYSPLGSEDEEDAEDEMTDANPDVTDAGESALRVPSDPVIPSGVTIPVPKATLSQGDEASKETRTSQGSCEVDPVVQIGAELGPGIRDVAQDGGQITPVNSRPEL